MKILFVSGGSYERLVKEAFRDPETRLTISEGYSDCLFLLQTFTPDLIITNDLLPDSTGYDLVKSIKEIKNDLSVVLLRDSTTEKALDDSLFSKIINMPTDPIALKKAICM